MEFMKNFGFQMAIFFRKIFHDFPKFLRKSLLHKIKKPKNFQNFLTRRQTKFKINVKNNKKIKKQIVNRKILK